MATVLSSEATGAELNNMPQIEMKLEIAIPGRGPYTIIHKQYINPDKCTACGECLEYCPVEAIQKKKKGS